MKRCAAALLALLMLALAAALPAFAQKERSFEMPEFDLPCRAAILVDQASGTVLYEKQADQPLPIASITKVMTLLLTMEALESGKASLTDVVPVSEHAYNMGGSQIWLEPGEQLTMDEMLKAICVSSANDAAVAVAEYIGGSEPVFVEQMNRKAAELGMSGTHFCNACGLDEAGHLSTARDVAVMSREMLNRHPQITRYTTIWMDSLRGGATQLLNTNKLLKRYSGITGLKTGTTGGAGVCISASATREGLSLIAVVLGAASSAERFEAATALLDYGFSNFEAGPAPLPADAPKTLPVCRGEAETVPLTYCLPETLLLKKGERAGLTVRLELPERAEAPLAQGQPLGFAVVMSGEEELGRWPVQAGEAVPQLDFGRCFRRLARAALKL